MGAVRKEEGTQCALETAAQISHCKQSRDYIIGMACSSVL